MGVREALVRRVESILKERGLAINGLANICGVTPSTFYSLMNGDRKDVNLTTVKKICDGLDMTLGEFFSSPEFDDLEQEIF